MANTHSNQANARSRHRIHRRAAAPVAIGCELDIQGDGGRAARLPPIPINGLVQSSSSCTVPPRRRRHYEHRGEPAVPAWRSKSWRLGVRTLFHSIAWSPVALALCWPTPVRSEDAATRPWSECDLQSWVDATLRRDRRSQEKLLAQHPTVGLTTPDMMLLRPPSYLAKLIARRGSLYLFLHECPECRAAHHIIASTGHHERRHTCGQCDYSCVVTLVVKEGD